MAKSQRGFAGMDPAAQREIARAGGRAAHQSGHAHEFTPEEAAEAGRKGGRARHHKSALLHQDAAAHRQVARAHESGAMEEAEQHPELAENNSEVTSFNRQADERSLDRTPNRETFEGDGQAMESSRRGPTNELRVDSPGIMPDKRPNESRRPASIQSGQSRRAGQRERSDNEGMEGTERSADENQQFEMTDQGEETAYGDSDDAKTGDVELLTGRDESRTSAARRGPGSETEDED